MWESFLKAAGSALIAYSTHYGVTKLYSNFCVPDGVWGFFQGALTTGSPVCQAGVQVLQHTQLSYSTLILMGTTRLVLDAVFPGASQVTAPVCAAATGTGC